MKKIVVISISLLIFFGCKDSEILPKQYPVVVMKDVQVESAAVNFTATFIGLGNSPIKKFGFIWSPGISLDSANLFTKTLESIPSLGDFSLPVTSDLENGKVYSVRPFAQTESLTVLGDVMTFESKGSNPPKIDNFFPKQGNSGDTITIRGSFFSLSKSRVKVFLGTDQVITYSTDANEIRFVLPPNLTKSGEVQLTVKSGDFTINANDLFLIEGQQILNFSPKNGIIGETEITISGVGFLEVGNRVRIGGFEAIMLEESNTELRVQLPYTMNTGDVEIDVDVNGKIATTSDFFTIKSRWTRLANFPGGARTNPFYVVIGDFLYVLGGSSPSQYMDDFWKFDLINNSWTQLPTFPGVARYGPVGFAIENSIYYGLGGGSGPDLDFWKYDTTTGEWTTVPTMGNTNYSIGTSFNGIGYIIADNGNNSTYFSFTEQDGWAYLGGDSGPSINKSYDNYFEIDGEYYLLNLSTDGYTGVMSYQFYKANTFFPRNWNFIEVPPFTNKPYTGICFVANGYAYIGEGALFEKDRLFMRLDVSTNEWTQIENYPPGLLIREAITFSYKDKGYAGLGLYSFAEQDGSVKKLNEFWMYDPSID